MDKETVRLIAFVHLLESLIAIIGAIYHFSRGVSKAFRYGPRSMKTYRIYELKARIKIINKMKDSVYELCLYVFAEASWILLIPSLWVFLVILIRVPPPFKEFDIAVFVASGIGRLARLFWKLVTLEYYERDMPKLKDKLAALEETPYPHSAIFPPK